MVITVTFSLLINKLEIPNNMKTILTIIFFATTLSMYSQLDTRATITTQGLVAKVWVRPDNAHVYPATPTNGVSANIAVSLPANGSSNTNDAPVIQSVTFQFPGISVSSQLIEIFNDRFVYTFLISGQTGAINWPAASENLFMSVTFNNDVTGDRPRLDNLLSSSGQAYFYLTINSDILSDTEGDAFYNGIEGTYPSTEQFVESSLPLPVTLVAFKAEKLGERNSFLAWTTASETNSSHFLVQRFSNLSGWVTIGKVDAKGSSQIIQNYKFEDINVYNGLDASFSVFYRLQMVDLDGQLSNSPVENVVFGKSTATSQEFAVYPNPATDGLQVAWDANALDQPTSLEFYDIEGKLIFTRKVSDNTNQEYIDLGQTNLQAGLYLLRIMNGTEPLEHRQIVVQR